ncbi:MAG: class I SAM-dependent rRNA methyltransferase [Bacilli bacterium]|nr:class I SAM-dependent rRNA methyltransferase [Bacilli bacterium]
MKVFLNKNEEIRLLEGHPWVFSNEVNHFEGKIKSGEICSVYSFDNKFIGKGFFNSNSKIMVRLLTREDIEIDESFFKNKIQQAYDYRIDIGLNDNFRMIFSEADDLSGLIVDKYGEYLSIQILSLGMEVIKDMIIKLLVEVTKCKGIYERSDVSIRKKEGLEEFKGIVYGDFDPLVMIEENGIKMYVDLENGQKTGYFLDQKYNRANLCNYVKNKVVLDCFSHTGGFALHAAKYGAKEIVAVDISEKAVNDISNNAKLNGFENIKAVQADVFEYLRKEENINKFDCIVLDPPAFTKSKETINKAYKGYKDINLQAMKIIKKGGFLFTFSCSEHMKPSLFLEMLEDAKKDSKRQIRLIDFRIQAPDHPTLLSSDEGLYLKCAVLHFMD